MLYIVVFALLAIQLILPMKNSRLKTLATKDSGSNNTDTFQTYYQLHGPQLVPPQQSVVPLNM